MNCCIGIDTSCYTTSVAIMDAEDRLLADCRRLLSVKQGSRGLSQSEMVFQHTRNLPDLFEQAIGGLNKPFHFIGIGVSSSPRPISSSYMPAFLPGYGLARSLSASLAIPLYEMSHQENHIYAGLWSANWFPEKDFLAVHLSGGTTEVVAVTKLSSKPSFSLVAGSMDLHAGQFIDRVGVALGLPFPAGPHVEQLAATYTGQPIEVPSVVREGSVSFSGPESHIQRLISQGTVPPAAIAAAVQACIGRSVLKMLSYGAAKTGIHEILLAGGVTANHYIRQFLIEKLHRQSMRLYIPDHAYSLDNAVGAAYFASRSAAKDVTA